MNNIQTSFHPSCSSPSNKIMITSSLPFKKLLFLLYITTSISTITHSFIFSSQPNHYHNQLNKHKQNSSLNTHISFTTRIKKNQIINNRINLPSFSSVNSILYQSETSSSDIEPTTAITNDNDNDDEEEEEEWEYEEFENLTESDFYNTEWKIGTYFDNSNEIKETWCRLKVEEDGSFPCIWGDGSKGKWKFDAPSQFLSMSKDTFGGWLGKKIWAGGVDDFYYLQGTVRGWSPISPASVLGQWQARRLGVSKEEAGVAPWFQDNDDNENETENVNESYGENRSGEENELEGGNTSNEEENYQEDSN